MYSNKLLKGIQHSLMQNTQCGIISCAARTFSTDNMRISKSFYPNKNRIKLLDRNCTASHVSAMHIRHFKTKNPIGRDNIVVSPFNEITIPDCLLHEFIWSTMDHWPDKIAIQCSVTGRAYTYAQLRKVSKTFGAALLKSGFKPGQVIAIMLPNCPEYTIAFLGAVEAGFIVTTINPGYTADETHHQVHDSNSVCIITYADKLDVAQTVSKAVEAETGGSKSVKIISLQDYDGQSRPFPQGVWSFREMLDNTIDTTIVDSVGNNAKPHEVVAIPYSSGTTGLPKGVCLTHHNLISNILQISTKETEQIRRPYGDVQDILPAVLPFFHIFGLNVIFLSSVHNGGNIVTLPKFEPELFLKTLLEKKSSVIYLVPPIVIFLGMHPAVKKEHLQYVRYITSGAAPLSGTDIEKLVPKLPESAYTFQGYGLTETSPCVLMPHNKCRNYKTVGTLTPVTKAKIIDENGNCLGIGKEGELCVSGPQVMKGYLNNPKATAATIDKDGWLHTGDIGYYDEDAHFYIVDRQKELIKVKGFQVAPAELEGILRTHPDIEDCAVIGVPDTRSGEVPVAYIVLKPGHEQVHPKSIDTFVSDKVTEYKRLSDIIITKAIPKSSSGKILRRILKSNHINNKK